MLPARGEWRRHDRRFIIEIVLSVLGVTLASAIVVEEYRTGWFRTRQFREQAVRFQDWSLDGKALRTVVAEAIGAGSIDEMTMLLEMDTSETRSHHGIVERDAQSAVAYLDRLLGIAAPDFGDNRAALLVCPLDWDLGCGGLSAELAFTDNEVSWRRLGWQNNYEDFSSAIDPELSVTFARAPYDELLISLRAQYASRVIGAR